MKFSKNLKFSKKWNSQKSEILKKWNSQKNEILKKSEILKNLKFSKNLKFWKNAKFWEKSEILGFGKFWKKYLNFFVLYKNVEKYIILGEVY